MDFSASDLSAEELHALIGFYAESGVADLCEDAAVDRFAQSAEAQLSRKQTAGSEAPQGGEKPRESEQAPARERANPAPNPSSGASRPAASPVGPIPQASQLTIPDEAAFKDARTLAAGAGTIDELRSALEGFSGCNLRHSAKSLVFADGNPDADVMFIGESPGRDEDLQGLPFVGRPGQLLDRMLGAIGMDRSTSYITTMIPWRPPGNRPPAPHEIELCRPFVERHIALAQPKILVLLGNISTRTLLGLDKNILAVRGSWSSYTSEGVVIPAMPTLNPNYLLRNPSQKKLAWADLLSLQKQMADLNPG
ncbi:MAG: uracil-DNA glycosylase [Hoeflea sp.]|uniref:uracil-DNA glycosylase n=1 Tax=Hoeflea sp. TaxID=1940281 RepID=UPI0032EC6FE2